MLITGFPSKFFDTNCYVLAPGDGEQCVIVDPGIGVRGRLDEVIAEHRLHPVAVLLTHGHLDHTFSVVPVCQARDVPAYIHPADRHQFLDPWTPIGMRRGMQLFAGLAITAAEPSDVREVVDGEKVSIAGMEFVIRSAPGHTKGSVVFEVPAESAVLSGDVIFAGSIGRTDFPGGSMEEMQRSLKDVILPMADETVLYPGHGPKTTVGRERLTNPYLTGLGPQPRRFQ